MPSWSGLTSTKMNPLIRELAEFSEIEVTDYHGMVSACECTLEELEKYTQLVIQRVTTIIAFYAVDNWENEEVSWCCENLIDDLRAHFWS
jgi:hypothetical protein